MVLRIIPDQAEWLERQIDALNEALAPLTSFILPGGSEGAARVHLARATVRRAERAATALAGAEPDLRFTRLDRSLWSEVPEDSIDYAVMEKATNVSVVRFDGHWSDMGSWESVWMESGKDAA